jgi:hypothetical protein
VLDLERRLAQAREHGIQATKEVQVAAQRVATENAKLRGLLWEIGYSDGMIDAWINEKTTFSPRRVEAQKCAVKQVDTPTMTALDGNNSSPSSLSPPLESSVLGPRKSTTQTCANTCADKSPTSSNVSSITTPCKLLSLLAENPAADISQVPLPLPQSEKRPCNNDKSKDDTGVDCSVAYKLLMQYATSDEKVDKIAAALESGCTPSASGGCKVKKSMMWKVLDEECI